MLKSIRGVFQRRCQCPFLCHLQHLLLSHLVENNGRYGWELHTLQLRTTDATVENNGRKLSVTVLRLSTNLLLSSAKFRLISMHYAHFCHGENESRQIQHHWQPCLFSFNTPKARALYHRLFGNKDKRKHIGHLMRYLNCAMKTRKRAQDRE